MSSRLILRKCLYGINVNEGPLFFASPVIKDKFNDVTHEIIQGSEILNGILYHVHRRMGRGGRGGTCPPSSTRNIN